MPLETGHTFRIGHDQAGSVGVGQTNHIGEDQASYDPSCQIQNSSIVPICISTSQDPLELIHNLEHKHVSSEM